MSTYETTFITAPVLSEEEEQALVSGFAEIVTDGGGTMVYHDRMGRRRLAFPVNKFDDGVYTRFLYDAEPAVPRELERRIRLSDKVLRWLTVRLEKDWAAAAKKQAERDAQLRAEAEARAAAEQAKQEQANSEAAAAATSEEAVPSDADQTSAAPQADDE